MGGRHVRTLVLLAWLATPRAWAEGLALLVPAYFDSSSTGWQQLTVAASRVPLVAIANLNNGPGTGPTADADYGRVLRNVRTAGGQVIGYVYTQYTRRSLEAVERDMRLWHERYPLDGFFVDEMTNDSLTSSLQYYEHLLEYARSLNPGYRVVANPGTNTQEAYLRRPTTDVLVIFEHHTGYGTFAPSAWTQRYSPTQFAHLPYAIEGSEGMTNALHLAVSRRAGFVYVTDDSGDNPWDRLPTYWAAEVAWVESANQRAAERVQSQLQLQSSGGSILKIVAEGAVGRHILEAASPLGEWRSVGTNLTNTGTSVWQVLNITPNRFFRLRQ